MPDIFKTLQIAARRLRNSPGFCLLAIAILTVGIGATTAMFSITRTVLLKPLDYRDPGRLVNISFRVPQLSKEIATIPVNAAHYLLWRDHSRTLEGMTVLVGDAGVLSGAGRPEHLNGLAVSPEFFRVLGVGPMLGRGFRDDENQTGSGRVVVISEALWQQRFGGRKDILGQTVRLDDEPMRVIGVMPSSFHMPRGHQLTGFVNLAAEPSYWRPLVFSKDELTSPMGDENYIAIARLKPSVSISQATTDMEALERVISRSYPEPVRFEPVVRPLQQAMARDVRLPLVMLMIAVCLVMLIVCINLMNLMTVRALAQRREWAIRLAVGAGLKHLLTGALSEAALLSAAGAVLGTLLSAWLLQLVRTHAPFDLPRIERLAIDAPVLLFAIALAAFSAVLFGLWPAWRATRVDPQEALHSIARGSTEGRRARWAGQLLVAAEVALSTVLLLSAGLLLRSFVNIMGVNPGIDVAHVLTAQIDLPPASYPDHAHQLAFYDRLRQRIMDMPGVQSAGFVSDLPITGEHDNNPTTAADRPAPPVATWPMTNYRSASFDYFQTAGIPLQAGRIFRKSDGDKREVVISQNLATRLWPGQNPIGHPLRLYGDAKPRIVIGVVGAVHAASLTDAPAFTVYFPDWSRNDSEVLVVRTSIDPESLSRALRRAVLESEPGAAVSSIRSMREIVDASMAQQKFQLVVLASFASAALLLASLGIYGVLAFATGRRTSEIGIRMAMGARPAQILGMSLRSGLTPVIAGMAVGLGVATSAERLLQQILFDVRPLDPLTYSLTCALLTGVAALACLAPARRAASLNPLTALRQE